MKVNLYDLFGSMDEQELGMIPEECITSPVDEKVIENVKGKVLDSIVAKKKRLPHRMGKIIAIAAAICILVSSLSVGATVYFKPDSNLSQLITIGDDIDISTMGRDMNITTEDSGLAFTLKQVLTDNSIMHFEIECPEYNGKIVYPETVDVYVNGKLNLGSYWSYWDESGENNILLITTDGLKNIKDNSDIEIKLDNICRLDNDEEVGIDGDWSLHFSGFRSDVKKRLNIENTINCGENEKYTVNNFIISPLGFSFDYKVFNTSGDSTTLGMMNINSFNKAPFVIIEMNDGTTYTDIIGGEKDSAVITVSASAQRLISFGYYGSVNGLFSKAINVDDIKSITVLDNVIYNG